MVMINNHTPLCPVYVYKPLAAWTHQDYILLQKPLLALLLKALDLIPDLEIIPAIKGDTTLSVFAHFVDILLLVLEGSDGT